MHAAAFRRKSRISLDEVAEKTKLSVRILRAIEEGDFAKLPGGIYNTSYLRQYARAIRFDEDELLASYRSATGGTPDGPSASSPTHPPRKPLTRLFEALSPR
jgi:cytoskeletal protein RodZ